MQLVRKSFAGNIRNWRRVSRVSAARAIASGGPIGLVPIGLKMGVTFV